MKINVDKDVQFCGVIKTLSICRLATNLERKTNMVITHCKQLNAILCTILRRSWGHNRDWRVYFFSEREKVKTSLFSCLNKHTENHLLLWRWLFHQVCVHSEQESEEGISGEHANFAFRLGISRGQKTNGRGRCLHSFSRELREAEKNIFATLVFV